MVQLYFNIHVYDMCGVMVTFSPPPQLLIQWNSITVNSVDIKNIFIQTRFKIIKSLLTFWRPTELKIVSDYENNCLYCSFIIRRKL